MVRRQKKQRPRAKTAAADTQPHEDQEPCNELHIAALEGNLQRVLQLVARTDVDINARADRGYTALHFAANAGELEVCELLLERGANGDLQTDSGCTALSLIRSHDFRGKLLYRKVVKLLKRPQGERRPSPARSRSPPPGRSPSPRVPPLEKRYSEIAVTPRRMTPSPPTPSEGRGRSRTRRAMPNRFQKSISTGDLLNTKQKDEIRRLITEAQQSVESEGGPHAPPRAFPPSASSPSPIRRASEKSEAHDLPSDTESNSDSTQRTRFLDSVLHPHSEADSPSSDVGEGVLFVPNSSHLGSTETEQSSSHDACLAQDLRKLNRTVSDVLNLMIESKRLQVPMTPRRRADLIELPEELVPPSSLSYEGPLLSCSGQALAELSLPALVESLLVVEDEEFQEDFWALHRFFVQPYALHELLQAHRHGPHRSRLLALYHTWLAHYFPDGPLYPRLLEEIAQLAHATQGHALAHLVASLPPLPTLRERESGPRVPLTRPPHRTMRLEEMGVASMAREITLLYAELFAALTTAQIALFSSCEDVRRFCPQVARIYDQNELMGRWILTEILTRAHHREQMRVLVFFIGLLEELLLLGNYQVANVVAHTLLSPEVECLGRTWEVLTFHTKALFQALVNTVARSLHYELFAYRVFKEHRPIIYDLDIVLKEFLQKAGESKGKGKGKSKGRTSGSGEGSPLSMPIPHASSSSKSHHPHHHHKNNKKKKKNSSPSRSLRGHQKEEGEEEEEEERGPFLPSSSSSSGSSKIGFRRMRVLSRFIHEAAALQQEDQQGPPSQEDLRAYLECLQPLPSKILYLYERSFQLTDERKPEVVQFYHKGAMCQIEEGHFSVVHGRVDDVVDILLEEELARITEGVLRTLCWTHTHYTSSLGLLHLLLQRFSSMPEHDPAHPAERQLAREVWAQRRQRVMHVLLAWFTEYAPASLPPPAVEDVIQTFLRQNSMLHADESFFFRSILEGYKRKRKASGWSVSPTLANGIEELPLGRVITPWQTDMIMKSGFAKHVAKQLCLIDGERMKKLIPFELLRESPEKNAAQQRWAAHFDMMYYWTASCIGEAKDTGAQNKTIRQFIKLARDCLSMKNFNSSCAITLGLDKTNISRFRKAWKHVPSDLAQCFLEMRTLFDMSGGNLAYRKALRETAAPAIPFMGVHTKDLFTLYTNNATFKEDGQDINFWKFHKMTDIIGHLHALQAALYDFAPDPSFQQYFHALDLAQLSESASLAKSPEPPSSPRSRSRGSFLRAPSPSPPSEGERDVSVKDALKDTLKDTLSLKEPRERVVKQVERRRTNPLHGTMPTPRAGKLETCHPLTVFSASGEKVVRVWNPLHGNTDVHKVTGPPTRVAFAPSSASAPTASEEGVAAAGSPSLTPPPALTRVQRLPSNLSRFRIHRSKSVHRADLS